MTAPRILGAPPHAASLVARALAVLRRIIGVPDYDAYLAHMRADHPAGIVLTRDEFTHERMRDKYNRPGQRCC